MGLFHKTFPATDIDPQTRGFINATLEKILNDFDDPTLRSKAKDGDRGQFSQSTAKPGKHPGPHCRGKNRAETPAVKQATIP